ncbi:MAG TPA: YibE/F family protein [Candidatus Paceibacterota bacterium]|nr:YibE/F family protein [Candidatus Paceibacterota bacterium]
MAKSFALLALFLLPFSSVSAQELVQDERTSMKAKVLEVVSQEERLIPGTDTPTTYQTLRVEILDGAEKGKVISVENDHLKLEEGDTFYLLHTVNSFDGQDLYTVSEPYRLPALLAFGALFLAAVVFFGGLQGIRGLAALLGSLLFIIYLLFPAVLAGYSPILVALGVASLIIILGSYVTHGFNRTTSAAVLGMVATIVFTGALAYAGVHFAHLSGFESDEAIYLNFDTRGAIDFSGLLLGGILIGLLGVLYDAAIGQAIAVEELSRAAPTMPRATLYQRALRMGREHIGALVNTLAIAYVGAALPLLLLFYSADADLLATLNREIFATEIIRTLVGSIGLVLAVPITTLVSVAMLAGRSHKQHS